jgi:hypothetical protein
VCPYVAGFLKRHDEFSDVADPVTPEVLRWLESELDRPPGRAVGIEPTRGSVASS